jgi:ATP-dependent DNA helicase PIF1
VICSQQADVSIQSFNSQQHYAFTRIENQLQKKEGGLFYINGNAGCGKTYFLLALVNHVRGLGEIALCCASSAWAARAFTGGQTAHRTFGIPVHEDTDQRPLEIDMSPDSQESQLLKSASMIVWDELPSTNKRNFEAADKFMKKLRGNYKKPFGGALVVAAGDFHQIPPVIEFGSRDEIIAASVKFSYLWTQFEIIQLTVPVRQENDPEYARYETAISVNQIL